MITKKFTVDSLYKLEAEVEVLLKEKIELSLRAELLDLKKAVAKSLETPKEIWKDLITKHGVTKEDGTVEIPAKLEDGSANPELELFQKSWLEIANQEKEISIDSLDFSLLGKIKTELDITEVLEFKTKN